MFFMFTPLKRSRVRRRREGGREGGGRRRVDEPSLFVRGSYDGRASNSVLSQCKQTALSGVDGQPCKSCSVELIC